LCLFSLSLSLSFTHIIYTHGTQSKIDPTLLLYDSIYIYTHSWGHDFRPAYRKLSWLRTHFASVPCMACTATATPKVMQDIQSCLQLPVVYQGRLDRHNIYYKVKYNKNYPSSIQTTTSALQDLSMTIQKLYQQHKESKTGCCGIVYAHKRTDTTMLATAIAKALGGTEKAAAYHGGLPKKERLRVLEGFACQTIPIVVATVAFGMGIDVSNVRVVIHWNMPKSLEAFAQESGRAGRDGLPCHSILYYCPEDYGKFQFLLRKQYQQDEQRGDKQKKRPDPKLLQSKLKALEQMRDYCITAKCRRNALISHFGGDAVDCGKTCDFCANPQRVSRTIQSSLVAPSKASTTRTSFASATKWDGQWSGPHGSNDDVDGFDDEDMIAKDWGGGFVGDLKVTGSSSKKSGGFGGMGGFKTASSLLKNPGGKNSILSVLNKYEVRM
jgi:bloom syndrome protein